MADQSIHRKARHATFIRFCAIPDRGSHKSHFCVPSTTLIQCLEEEGDSFKCLKRPEIRCKVVDCFLLDIISGIRGRQRVVRNNRNGVVCISKEVHVHTSGLNGSQNRGRYNRKGEQTLKNEYTQHS